MITWTKVMQDHWKIIYKNKTFWIESLEKLFVYNMAFGIECDEIEFALLTMEQNNHNYAEFSSGKFNGEKTFIYSEKRSKV